MRVRRSTRAAIAHAERRRSCGALRCGAVRKAYRSVSLRNGATLRIVMHSQGYLSVRARLCAAHIRAWMSQGFLPSILHSQLPARSGPLLRVVSVAALGVYLVTLVAFCTFAVLGQRGGVQLADTLISQHSALLTAAEQVNSDAAVVQGVISGTTTVAGEDISAAFVPNPPSVEGDAQVSHEATTLQCMPILRQLLVHQSVLQHTIFAGSLQKDIFI